MSLPDRPRGFRKLHSCGLAALALALSMVAACTVRPLYSDAPAVAGEDARAKSGLHSIAIKPVSTRYAQEVRNHLIFGLNGGAGQPDNPLYTVDLGVTLQAASTATVQRVTEDEPTAGTMTLTSNYVITDTKTGKVLARGVRDISSSYDVPRQGFAELRAQRNAEDRAARQLAELLRLAIAQDLARADSGRRG